MKIFKNLRRTIMIVLSVSMLIGYVPDGEPQLIHPVPGGIRTPAERVKEPVRIPAYPRIREFSLTPNVWLTGETGNITFRWRVEPGPGGSPVRSVAITRKSGYGPAISYSGGPAGGLHALDIPSASLVPEGRTIYTLTATDEKGATSTKTAVLEAKSMSSVRGDISLVTLTTEPAEISEDSPFTFILQLNNRSGVRVPGVNIPVRGKDLGMMEAGRSLDSLPPPPNQGELRAQVIEPGINTYRIRCAPGVPPGLAERYLFEMVPVYGTWTISYIWARLEFSRSTADRTYYRIRYGIR
ncbi:MAG: hypothetical protein OEW04_00905 [Nitrospirota bacterium]|nr:hypothetical protein [Nitrospirota bacterium]